MRAFSTFRILPLERQDGLGVAVTAHLRAATRALALDQEDLRLVHVCGCCNRPACRGDRRRTGPPCAARDLAPCAPPHGPGTPGWPCRGSSARTWDAPRGRSSWHHRRWWPRCPRPPGCPAWSSSGPRTAAPGTFTLMTAVRPSRKSSPARLVAGLEEVLARCVVAEAHASDARRKPDTCVPAFVRRDVVGEGLDVRRVPVVELRGDLDDHVVLLSPRRRSRRREADGGPR